jgi:hypothetical protein
MQTKAPWLGWIALLAPAVLMFDFWNWSDARPLLFGWMPVGLWWPALITIFTVPLYWLAFKLVWPDDEPESAAVEESR